MNTEHTAVYLPTDPHAPRQIITARTVGWALSGAAIGSLLLGLIVVEYFGRVSGRPPIRLEPKPVESFSQAPPDRPTVLPPMGRHDQADEEPERLDSFFAPDVGQTQRIDTAAQSGIDWH